jgi:hypothetical protein
VAKGRRRPYNEFLDLYASLKVIRLIKSRSMRWDGRVTRMGTINVYKILVETPLMKKPLRRPRHRWEDNIKMDLTEIGLKVGNWIHLAQDRDQWLVPVNTVMNLRVP